MILVHNHDIMKILNKFDDFHGILAISEGLSTVQTKSRYFGCSRPKSRYFGCLRPKSHYFDCLGSKLRSYDV